MNVVKKLWFAAKHPTVSAVYYVDGSALRKSITYEEAKRGADECMADFLDYGIYDDMRPRAHGGFRQVPVNEIWIADELGEREQTCVLNQALYRLELLNKGIDPETAFEETEQFGKESRSRFDIKEREYRLEQFIPIDYQTPGVTPWVVDGNTVRTVFLNRFIQGGHGFVYPFVPKFEIWIDSTLDEDERLPVLVHEYTEMCLMRKGMGYDEAHDRATDAEYKYR